MTATAPTRPPRYLRADEVATLFRVDPKTVTRWAKAGKLGSIRTPGGHYRFLEADVLAQLATTATPAGDA